MLAKAVRQELIARGDRVNAGENREMAQTQPRDYRELVAAIGELTALERHENRVQPRQGQTQGRARPFTLSETARKRLSEKTMSLLKDRGIDLDVMPLDEVVHRLTTQIANLNDLVVVWPGPIVTVTSGITLPPPPAEALVRPAGVADLLLVKQQIKRYEAGEIAHVENVVIGEKKSSAQRQLERTEETFVTETEVIQERQTELETADRFELNRETSRTIKMTSRLDLVNRAGAAKL